MAIRLTRRRVLMGATATAVAPIPLSLEARTPKTHDIGISSFSFVPALVHARIGDVLRWTNTDLAPHTATADMLGWDTGTLEQHEAGEIQVTEGMESTYFCVFHPHMTGKIRIVG
ncbi:copper-binding protein [uncultured Tateyamaria sp.]|uniref:copper-binding protein n=1 Tax=Tateyamaria sp. 1078 TaxID=3417464 RepID=UPI0026213384|nr:copper-binding protein [uncultured Tateyamaria sp.]